MDTIHHLLSHIATLVKGLVVVIILLFLGRLVVTIYPQYSLKNLLTFTPPKQEEKKDAGTEFFLPEPGSLSIKHAEPPTAETNVYTDQHVFVPNSPYDGGGQTAGPYKYSTYSYSEYTSGHDYHPDDSVFDAAKSGYFSSDAYLRSITLPNGAFVYQNIMFSGEAREEMFVNGRFSLYVISREGKAVGGGVATALDDWSMPGWHRFSAKIGSPVPAIGVCGLVFQQDKPNGLHMVMPIRCGK